MKALIAFAAITACCLGNAYPASAQQLIDDRKVGVILGEVQCGKRDINNAVRYLNAMGVPQSKLMNMNNEALKGFGSVTAWC